MRQTIALGSIAITVLLAAGCGGGGGGATTTGTTTSKSGKVGLLFVQAAPHGTLVSAAGANDRFTLTLRDTARQVIWFSDRPERHYGHLAVERFVRAWKSFGFGSDPPNAALTLLRADDEEDTLIVELGAPRYDAAQNALSFPARVLPHANGRLADFEAGNDGHVPERFADASLFIDDTSSFGPITGCHGCQY
jgi:hypothetical protein